MAEPMRPNNLGGNGDWSVRRRTTTLFTADEYSTVRASKWINDAPHFFDFTDWRDHSQGLFTDGWTTTTKRQLPRKPGKR